ncbi:MAG: tetratricopeptide repeat protein, partial [Anaerolineae bacterium]
EEVAEAETKEEAPAPKAEAEVAEIEPEEVEEAAAPEVAGMSLDEQRAYVEEHDSDHKARLALARALWAAGEGEESISHYTQLIRSDELMEHVIDDLQEHSAEQPDNPRPLRALGDAYMKQGLLDKALKTYQEAMNRL